MEWDRAVLERLQHGQAQLLAQELEQPDFAAQGGNGGAEVRQWLAMAGATDDAKISVLHYSAIPALITGMAVVAVPV